MISPAFSAPADDTRVALLREGEEMLDRLRGTATVDDVARAAALAKALKDKREFAMLARLREAVGRHAPERAPNEGLWIQAIITEIQ